jgi:hypothetical protein
MTRKELLKKKITELRSMAKELGLSIPRTATKEELAALISKTLRLKALRAKKKPEKVSKVTEKGERIKRAKKPVAKVTAKEALPELKPVSVEEERPVSAEEVSLPVIKDLLGLVPVNQTMFYLYWEITQDTASSLRKTYGGRFVIRIYEVTGGRPIESAPFFDLIAPREEGGAHIDMGRSGAFCAIFGVLTEDGRFIPILRSNTISLPELYVEKGLSEPIRISFPSGVVHPTSL